ncbi:MAG: hypothetical protein CL693_06395 [Cellvibrionaceae bacterium]|mgnify:CR=1 FL=1|nr:hypothetical protein [Cellvibrionaceae bacterium]|tara:strand:+ start:43769 stop:44158 length:390 start_codon:yes stop_codon:yes gene_type:complete
MSIEKQTYRAGPYKNVFAQAVKTGNVIHLSGQVGMDSKGKLGADMVEQTEIAYANIKHVLSEMGASLDNIVDETMFVTDMGEFMTKGEALLGARAKAYGGVPEVCQTVVQVTALVMPELKIEIKCVAHV